MFGIPCIRLLVTWGIAHNHEQGRFRIGLVDTLCIGNRKDFEQSACATHIESTQLFCWEADRFSSLSSKHILLDDITSSDHGLIYITAGAICMLHLQADFIPSLKRVQN